MKDMQTKTTTSYSISVNGKEMTREEVEEKIRQHLQKTTMPGWLKPFMPDNNRNGIPDIVDQLQTKLKTMNIQTEPQLPVDKKITPSTILKSSYTSDKEPTSISLSSSNVISRNGSGNIETSLFERPKHYSVEKPIKSGNSLNDMPAVKALLMIGGLIWLGWSIFRAL